MGTPVRDRASHTSKFIEKSVQYVYMHTIFDTRVELLPVVELYLWYWQVPTYFWTVLIKVPVWKTFFTEPFATCSCIHRVGQGPRFQFCSVNGAALVRFIFTQIPWTFGYLCSKREAEAFVPNSRAQLCTGSIVVAKLWYGMCGAVRGRLAPLLYGGRTMGLAWSWGGAPMRALASPLSECGRAMRGPCLSGAPG